MPKSQIRAAMESAAKAIATLPVGQRHHWLLWVLEALQDEAADYPDVYEEMLERIAESINTRLEGGRW